MYHGKSAAPRVSLTKGGRIHDLVFKDLYQVRIFPICLMRGRDNAFTSVKQNGRGPGWIEFWSDEGFFNCHAFYRDPELAGVHFALPRETQFILHDVSSVGM